MWQTCTPNRTIDAAIEAENGSSHGDILIGIVLAETEFNNSRSMKSKRRIMAVRNFSFGRRFPSG
jgi:hypothetical protein